MYEVKIASPSTWDPSNNKKIFRVMAKTRVRVIGNGCSIEGTCSPPSADSKCKEVLRFYCSSLAVAFSRRNRGPSWLILFCRAYTGCHSLIASVEKRAESKLAPQFWILLQPFGKLFYFLLQFIDGAFDLVQGCSNLLVLNGV